MINLGEITQADLDRFNDRERLIAISKERPFYYGIEFDLSQNAVAPGEKLCRFIKLETKIPSFE